MSGENKGLRDYHQARWNEPMIFEMTQPGERGVLLPRPEPELAARVGDPLAGVPEHLLRCTPLDLPEVAQNRVLRHFLRLSQETLGADMTVEASHGTCTMKYSPKFQEHLTGRHPGITEVHPLQPPETIQGLLEIYWQVEDFLKRISGLDAFTFQPGGGAQAVFANACVVRAYHASRGEAHRDEVITTMFSHPSNAAAPATAGFRIITIMPGADGFPDMEAFRSALSPRTAAVFLTNPEDTGLYNPRIQEITRAAHDAGALCSYDQANANSLLGIARAREAGFDLCHFNLHKTFSAPHGCMGPACGAEGVTAELERFLPVPRVVKRGDAYHLDLDRPDSIGRVRGFFGNAPIVVRAYAWMMQHGDQGLREAAQQAVLASNYMEARIRRIPGVTVHYAEGRRRLEQVRYSWDALKAETGVGTDDVKRRMTDFGLQQHWTSHHPHVVPEPFTIEPTESYSQADLDEYVAVLARVSEEAHQNPELVTGAPHRTGCHKVPAPRIDEAERIAVTWRQYRKLRREAGKQA